MVAHMLRGLFALILLLILGGSASAATYTVCPSGCDTDCAGAPAQLTAMNSADIMEIKAGVTCVGISLVSPLKANITIRGETGGVRPALNGNGAVAIAVRLDNTGLLSNIDIYGYTGIAIQSTSSNRTYSVRDVSVDGGTGCMSGLGNGSVVERVYCNPASGQAIASSQASVFRNVVVARASNNGIAAGLSTCTHVTVSGVTGGTWAINCGTAFYSVAAGNTNPIGIRGATDRGYNLTHGHSTNCDAGNCGTGTIQVDPLFVGSGSLALQATSPAINAATGSTETVDVLGVARTTPDMGAYEWIASGPGAGNRWPRVGATGSRTLRVGTDGVRVRRVQ